jgi:hypothetical protein
MPVSPARSAAFEILLRVESSDAYASELLHSARFEKLSRADHGLLTELVMGVLRWRGIPALAGSVHYFSREGPERHGGTANFDASGRGATFRR